MEAQGFTVNPNEWWHFDYKDWEKYAIYDIPFSAIRNLNDLKGLIVRRVEISGNVHVRDRIVREKIPLKEGDVFSEENLQKTVKQINDLNLFEKISEQDISWFIDKIDRDVDFVINVREKE